MSSHKVTIQTPYTTQSDINECIQTFRNIDGAGSTLTIEFEQPIEEIDILLVGYLMMFKELRPDLTIEIRLQAEIASEQENDLAFKLYQYLDYAFLMSGRSVFEIYYRKQGNTHLTGPLWIDENSANETFQRFFVLSDHFMPILLVNKKNQPFYDLLFEEAIVENIKELQRIPESEKLQELLQAAEAQKSKPALYLILNRWIKGYEKEDEWISGVISPKERNVCIQYLARLAFYKALENAKILRAYLSDPEILNTVRVGRLRYSEKAGYPQVKFFRSIKPVFDELSSKPPIYHFIYSLLLSAELPGELFEDEVAKEYVQTKESFKNSIEGLWKLTKEIAQAVTELAKNIREHADPPFGVITGRIYKSEIWSEMKRNAPNAEGVLDSYLKSLDSSVSSLLDFNVVDLGTKGVVETLAESSATWTDEDLGDALKTAFEEDVETLKTGDIQIQHFLDPTKQLLLNQQAKRATAHLGLQIFSRILRDHGGMIRAGTWNGQNRDDTLVSPGKGRYHADTIPHGTNFHFVLPAIWGKEEKGGLIPHERSPESSALEIKGLEELLEYKVVELRRFIRAVTSFENEKKYLIIAIPDKLAITDREIEQKFWKNFDGLVKHWHDQIEQNLQHTLCLDLEGIVISGSTLFRLLGKWELIYPKLNLMISNMKTSTYNELVEINEGYISRSGSELPYWNNQTVTLIYSYCPLDDNKRFYFADALWGKELQDFININKLIRNSNFNATTVLLADDASTGEYNHSRLSEISKSGFFHSKTALLPFDLLLSGPYGISLFEHNASTLLQNELGVKSILRTR